MPAPDGKANGRDRPGCPKLGVRPGGKQLAAYFVRNAIPSQADQGAQTQPGQATDRNKRRCQTCSTPSLNVHPASLAQRHQMPTCRHRRYKLTASPPLSNFYANKIACNLLVPGSTLKARHISTKVFTIPFRTPLPKGWQEHGWPRSAGEVPGGAAAIIGSQSDECSEAQRQQFFFEKRTKKLLSVTGAS